jgi:hypothetical protein
MKKIFLMMFWGCSVAGAQSARQAAAPCPVSINLTITRQAGQTVFHLQEKSYPKYPLDVIGRLGNQCSKTDGMNIIVESDVPLDDVVTALNGAGKNQIDHVSVFIKKNSFFLPLAIGQQTSKDPTK